MADCFSKETRSKVMAAVKSKNTQPEVVVRKYLHASGYRFRLHKESLPGSPDIVMPKYRLAIFVNGCFWHGHANCRYSNRPKTRRSFWAEKLSKNLLRDKVNRQKLMDDGWRVLVVWECGVKHCSSSFFELPKMIESGEEYMEWPIKPPKVKV